MTSIQDSRRFQRLRPEPSAGPGYSNVAADGMCLSAFLLVHPGGSERQVLLGRVDPSQPWAELGALDAERVRALAGKWMLPSSHLLEFEEPEEAAHRIAGEQLEVPSMTLRGPEVRSEAYHREATPTEQKHWDIHFIFRGEWPADRMVRARPFAELRFFSYDSLPPEGIARGGGDILVLAGLVPGRP